MLFLPVDKIDIVTDKSPAQVKHIFDEKIASSGIQNYLFWNKNNISGKIFEGNITEDKFILRRIVRYWNFCLPIISGSVKENDTATVVHAKMRMTVLDEVFYTILSVVFIVAVISMIVSSANSDFYLKLELSGISLAGLIIMTVLYKSEAKRAKHIIKFLLNDDVSIEHTN